MFIASMGIEEHKHAAVSKITSTKAITIKAVNLRVSKDVSDALEIHNHKVTMSDLPGVVTQSLGNQRLIGILTHCRPSSVVVVLLVLTSDEVFTIVILEGSTIIQDFINERMNKLYQIFAIH